MRAAALDRMEETKEVWIGLLGIKPLPGNDLLSPGALGAYVQTLAWASSQNEYLAEIGKALKDYGFSLEEYNDLEPIAVRSRKMQLEDPILKLASEVRATKNVRFGIFNNYFDDGSKPS